MFSVLIPWVTLREVPVEVEIPSPKVAVLRFNRGMQQGLLGRISRTSIMEYHAFGIISEGRDSPHHYMICGVQGDFTKDLVANPPKTVWTRELKFGMLLPTPRRYRSLTRSQLASVMPPQCSRGVSVFVPGLVLVPRSRRASRAPTGS